MGEGSDPVLGMVTEHLELWLVNDMSFLSGARENAQSTHTLRSHIGGLVFEPTRHGLNGDDVHTLRVVREGLSVEDDPRPARVLFHKADWEQIRTAVLAVEL